VKASTELRKRSKAETETVESKRKIRERRKRRRTRRSSTSSPFYEANWISWPYRLDMQASNGRLV